MNFLKKLFHRCGEHLEYIEGSRFPETGTTGRGKVWRNYRCTICGKLYTACDNELFRIKFPYQTPIKTNVGGYYN